MPSQDGFTEPLQQVERTRVLYRGRKLLYFGGCDYLRLSSHRQVVRAIGQGMRDFGLNVSASRKTTGNHPLYEKLERELARFFGMEAALVTASGYTTNLAVAQGLEGKIRWAFIDERAHPSLRDAARLLGAKVIEFKHRQGSDLRKKLGRARGRYVIMTDGMFPLNGALAPLGEYKLLLNDEGILWIDDAHAAGVLGKGRGTRKYFNIEPFSIIQTTTLSKGFGVFGGVILGAERLRKEIVRGSGLVAGSTPLPLPLISGALASLRLVREGKLIKKLESNLAFLGRRLSLGKDLVSPILALSPSKGEADDLRKQMLRNEIFPTYIRYPGTEGEGIFRFAVSSEHTEEELGRLGKVLAPYGGYTV